MYEVIPFLLEDDDSYICELAHCGLIEYAFFKNRVEMKELVIILVCVATAASAIPLLTYSRVKIGPEEEAMHVVFSVVGGPIDTNYENELFL